MSAWSARVVFSTLKKWCSAEASLGLPLIRKEVGNAVDDIVRVFGRQADGPQELAKERECALMLHVSPFPVPGIRRRPHFSPGHNE
jgi:hypothetical protein